MAKEILITWVNLGPTQTSGAGVTVVPAGENIKENLKSLKRWRHSVYTMPLVSAVDNTNLNI